MSTQLSTPLDEQTPSSSAWDPVGSGFGIRAAAQTIDTFVHIGVWCVLNLLLGVGLGIYEAATGVSAESMLQKSMTPAWYDFAAGALGFALYHAVMERRCGATVGKRMLRLAVVNTSGGLVTYRQALGRSLLFYIDSLFFGLVAYSTMKPPLQQRLGDKRNGTLVVARSILPFGTVNAMSHFGTALLLGALSDAGCGFVSACIGLS